MAPQPTTSSTYTHTPTPGNLDIPSAPTFAVLGQAAASAVSSAASHISNAYNAAASAYANQISSYPPASTSNCGASRAPPLNNADPRVKDTVELCNFAIAALKVRILYTFSMPFLYLVFFKCIFVAQ